MVKLVVLKLEGDIQEGLRAAMEIGLERDRPCLEVCGRLPQNSQLIAYFQDWEQKYDRVAQSPQRIKIKKITYNGSVNWHQKCRTAAGLLSQSFNEWLGDEQFRPIDRRLRGVGKTTCTANLGMALAQRGRRVVLVDADFGLRNLDLLLGLENRIVYTAMEAIAGQCRLEQALVKDKRQTKLALLPAAQNRMKDAVAPEQMKQVVDELVQMKYDYILIDSPAGIEAGFQNAIAPAQESLIVTTPEIAAVRDADRVIGLLEAHGVKKISLIVNRLKPEMVEANDMMSVEDVREILAIDLMGVIPDDERVIVSTNRGEPLVLGEEKTIAGEAFDNISRRLEGEKVEFLDLNVPQESFFGRLRKLLSKKII